MIERHAGIPLSSFDVYVSVMGGIKLTEPGADLPIALAIISAYADVPLRRTVAWGELGLTGEIRSVTRQALRRSESERIAASPILAPDGGATLLFEVLIECGLGTAVR